MYSIISPTVCVLFLTKWRTLSGETTSPSRVRHFGYSSVSVSMQSAPSKSLSPKERVRQSTFKTFSNKLLYNPFSIFYQPFEPGKEVNNPAQVNINHNDRIL